jgi:hypothetical protein
MTAAGVQKPPPGTAPGAVPARASPGRTAASLCLVWLYLASRRVPAALAALAACGATLRAGLEWHWISGTGPGAQQVPSLLEAGAASVIAVTTYTPVGEPERVTGRWLPWLRLGTAVALAGAAVAMLAAAATAAHLPDGILAIGRNVAGATGIGLLSASVIGGALAWIGPMTYTVMAEYALLAGWTSPWVWPGRPPHDRGAAVCAALVFAGGTAVITVRGARDPAAGDGGGYG